MSGSADIFIMIEDCLSRNECIEELSNNNLVLLGVNE